MPANTLNISWTRTKSDRTPTEVQADTTRAHIGTRNGRRPGRLVKARPASAGKSVLSVALPGSARRGSLRNGSSGKGHSRPSSGRGLPLGGRVSRPNSGGQQNLGSGSSRPSSVRRHARTGSNVGVWHMRVGSESSAGSRLSDGSGKRTSRPPNLTFQKHKPRRITLAPTSALAQRALAGCPVTPRGGVFQIPVAGNSIDGDALGVSQNERKGFRIQDRIGHNDFREHSQLRYHQGDLTEPAVVPSRSTQHVEEGSNAVTVRDDPCPTEFEQKQKLEMNARLGFYPPGPGDGLSFVAPGREDLTTSTTAQIPPSGRRGLELVRPSTESGTNLESDMAMAFLTRPGTGSLRSMTFPRAAMSDVELRSEWSSSEDMDGRLLNTKGKTRARLHKSPRRTVEGDRPRRTQSERWRLGDSPRQTSESERPRSDRPSADQKRFGSLLRVRERARVISNPTVPDLDELLPPKIDRTKRGSWLAGLKFTRSPTPSRAPTPSPVPSLAPIPSLSPITSPLGPIFQVSPATPGEKSIFGSVGEDVCSEQVPDEPWSHVTGASRSADGKSEHEPRMLSRANSSKAPPPRPPPPSRPVPVTPEFILPDDRRQREATIRPSSRSRPPSATELGLNGDIHDKPSFLDELDVVSDDDYGEDIPPGTATTIDEPRIAGSHRPQLSISSRVPVTESNIRWSAAGRSRSGSNASASQWRGASVYVESDQDQDDYGIPSPLPPDTSENIMDDHGGYNGLVGPRRDLYSDDELESVLEESESLSEHDREDRTAAMIIADEGRGLIVDAEGRPVSQLDVQTGTTHLLLGSSPTASVVSPFLAQILPQISSTLLCLDISNNELTTLPAALTSCIQLEELNVSNNPLRTLPSTLGALISLRVLIADGCEIQSLPAQLVQLGALHSLSVRSNRLVMLPVWMCAMPSLEVLKIEGNTFAGPWRNLVEPLLPRDTSYSPPATNGVYGAARAANSLPLLSTSTNGSGVLASPILLNRPGAGVQRSYSQQPQPSSAIDPRWSGNGLPIPSPYPTSNSAPHSPPRHALSPPSGHVMMSPPPATGLAHLQLPIQSPPTTAALNMHLGALAPTPRKKKKRAGGGSISGSEIMTTDAESEVEATTSWASGPRRMKSADELRRMATASQYEEGAPPSAPILTTAPTLPEPQQGQVKRYMSLGVRNSPGRPDARQMWAGGSARNSTVGVGSRNPTGGPRGSRYSGSGLQAQKVEEDEISPDVSFEFGAMGSEEDGRPPSIARAASDERVGQRYSGVEDAYAQAKSTGTSPEEQRRKGRWGFLKKVSMGRLRSHSHAERLGRTLPPAQVESMPAMPTRPQPIAPPPAPPRVDVTSAGSPASSVLTARMLSSKRSQEGLNGAPSPGLLQALPSPAPRAKRRSFLPFDTPPTLNIPIPSGEPFMPNVVALGGEPEDEGLAAEEAQRRADEEVARQHLALRGIMSYLRDMADLEGGIGANLVPARRPPLTQYMDGRTKSDGSYASSTSTPPMLRSAPSTASLRGGQDSVNTTDSSGSYGQFAEDRKYKDDKGRRVAIVREIVETEKSYVKGLQELLDIYVKPASEPAPGLNVSKETTIPAAERKIVFTGVDALLQFHKQSFLPSLISAAEILSTAGPGEDVSTRAAHAIANVFVSHAAFMKMYFTYINNFDNAIQRLQFWSAPPSAPNTPGTTTPASNTPSTVGVGLSMVAMGVAGVAPDQPPHPATLNAGQRKRIKQFLKRCRLNPRHSQLNLEGYLLLPIQRIPRYKMLLDNLVTCTPPHPEARDDPLERALEEIAVLANSMNEGKRESESRTKLVQWQSRIRGKFISPLVQPHRRLIMDGRLQLVRLVKKVNSRVDMAGADGSLSQVEVPCLSSDANPKQLVAILCNDLLVLCKETPGAEQVELWAVLRMQTMAQPASIVSGNGLRIVDNKAILYFNTQSTSEALTWQRAINLHIPHAQ